MLKKKKKSKLDIANITNIINIIKYIKVFIVNKIYIKIRNLEQNIRLKFYRNL